MATPDKPLEQMTAQERLKLGRSLYKDGKFDEAIAVWSKITREEADSEIYARALLGLGAAYAESGKLDQAIKILSNISHDNDPETYAWALLGLGAAYKNQDELDEAITAWSKIRREEADSKTYTQAQLNLGAAYKNQDELDEAITVWSKITREEADSKTYARAQLNLGAAYAESGKLDEAITIWSKITREEADSEIYARALLGLGAAYAESGKLDQAIKILSNISHDNDPETYARAQLNLGVTYHAQGELEEAITAWSNIHHDDDPEPYAQAQFNLGITYKDQSKPEEAITAWSNIHHDDDPDAYAKAQFNLGKIYEYKGDIKQAKEAYRNVQGSLYYRGEREYKILECPPEVIKKLHDIARNTDKVREVLQIIPEFESKVAHYSRASTAFNLFGDERNNKNPSNFRLSTIRGVNDPTEGLVLRDYWEQQGISENIYTNDTATFISCFTFNHDSLNQFRLYGKENGREATGVSLVFDKDFFSDQSDVLEFISGPSTDLSSKSEQVKLNDTGKTESDNKKPLIGKSTLYRCIYLDPETGYWTLAQRDKSTFYREHNEDEDAKEKWEKYYGLISDKEEYIEKYLFNEKDNNNKSISSILKSIFTEYHLYNKCNKDEKQKILEAIRFILLPLQYLVKHIAFQEEQECRIMYITQFRDEKIHSDREKQWMYVEYEEPVLPHIDKIWLSPGAAKDQDFFRILLDKGENDNKVRISQNPFRNKE